MANKFYAKKSTFQRAKIYNKKRMSSIKRLFKPRKYFYKNKKGTYSKKTSRSLKKLLGKELHKGKNRMFIDAQQDPYQIRVALNADSPTMNWMQINPLCLIPKIVVGTNDGQRTGNRIYIYYFDVEIDFFSFCNNPILAPNKINDPNVRVIEYFPDSIPKTWPKLVINGNVDAISLGDGAIVANIASPNQATPTQSNNYMIDTLPFSEIFTGSYNTPYAQIHPIKVKVLSDVIINSASGVEQRRVITWRKRYYVNAYVQYTSTTDQYTCNQEWMYSKVPTIIFGNLSYDNVFPQTGEQSTSVGEKAAIRMRMYYDQ